MASEVTYIGVAIFLLEVNNINQMEGKEYKVEIPRTTLAVKTYKEATDIMETLFGLGVRDVNIVAFRPNPDGSCC